MLINLNLNSYLWLGTNILNSAGLETSSSIVPACHSVLEAQNSELLHFSPTKLVENFHSHLKQKKENGDFTYTYRVSPTHLNRSSQHVQVEENHTKGDR